MEVRTSREIASPELPISRELAKIRKQVVVCRRCPRLVEYREAIARKKRKEFEDWNYWGRPVPGLGDPSASIMIVGLAPAAHGGNRTGRVFTGDRSGDFLYKALFKAGLANQPQSVRRDDGLILKDAYITAAVKCAPPDNKPFQEETENCSGYLSAEIGSLPNLKVILCLGQFAFRTVLNIIRNEHRLGRRTVKFAHGSVLTLGQGLPQIVCSYHPSPRNTQTGKLSEKMLISALNIARNRAGISRKTKKLRL